MDLSAKSDRELQIWIENHEAKSAQSTPLYSQLIGERLRRARATQLLDLERSLAHLKEAAVRQTCTTYGDLATASGIEWSRARHQMNGTHGHLDRLLDLCRLQELPLLTAICVNRQRLAEGELGDDALDGFAAGAQRLGYTVADAREFHHKCRDECWTWGRAQGASLPPHPPLENM